LGLILLALSGCPSPAGDPSKDDPIEIIVCGQTVIVSEYAASINEVAVPAWGTLSTLLSRNMKVKVDKSNLFLDVEVGATVNILVTAIINGKNYGAVAKGVTGGHYTYDLSNIGGVSYEVYATDGGSEWYLLKVAYYDPSAPIKFYFASSEETLASVSAPAYLDNKNEDARINSGLLEVQTAVDDVIIVNSEGGWQYGSTLANSSYQITGLLTPYSVYTKKGATWYKVNSGYYVPSTPQMIDFNANLDLLGLVNGTNYNTAGYGTTVINAMDGRINFSFYTASLGPYTVEGISVSTGLANGDSPPIGFGFNTATQKLVIHGQIIEGPNGTIKFDIAVIDPDGKGWLNGYESVVSPVGTLADSYSLTADTSGTTMTRLLSELTCGSLTSLGCYRIYIIVRETNGHVGIDCNNSYWDRNVISVASMTP
jgi:hypothetical protein